MSKKMWQKIFKTKSVQKNPKTCNKIDKNKRCSIYEEYQQLNGLNDLSKQTRLNAKNENLSIRDFVDCSKNEISVSKSNEISNNISKNTIDLDERPLPAQQQQQHQQQSTFSRVVNTLTLSKRHQQINKQQKTNKVDNRNGNGKGNLNENGSSSMKTKKNATTAAIKTTKTAKIAKTKNENNKENTIASNEEEEIGSSTLLTPCPTCSRTFNTVALSKHITICQKMATKKRKPFDSSRQRREGTELAAFLPKNFGLPPSKQTPEHAPVEERLIRNTARASLRGQPSSLNSSVSGSTNLSTPTPISPKPNMVSAPKHERHSSLERSRRNQATAPVSQKCPHCIRYFGIKAYDRHVEWCKEKALQSAIKNSNNEKNKAKERLVARTQYRAPIKTKRSLNREKYAGLMGDENDGDEIAKVMTSSMASDRIEDDDISVYSQESHKSRLIFRKPDRESSETQIVLDNAKEASVISPKSTLNENELNENQLSLQPISIAKESPPQDLYFDQAEDFEEYPQEVSMQSNQNVFYRVSRQFTEPNLRLHTTMPSNKSQYFIDDMYPMLNMNSPLYIQQQQQMQIQRNQINCFPNPFVSFDANPMELKRKVKKKSHRKSGASGQVLNPNIPLKAFNMPFGDPNMIGMPDIYRQMMLPLNLEAPMSIYDNTNSGDWDEPSSGDEPIHAQPQENVTKKPRLKSSLTDSTYDPFLSAKRQLEDLCASNSPPDNDTHLSNYNTKPLSTPTTPSAIMPTKMTTSLTLSVSIPSNTSSPITPNSIRKQSIGTPTATNVTPISNFRRTSSLRGPRRSPLLNARPFFAQKRPIIQRGLSDEGPISTNFLKSEEYDEIPVRSVCVNDFAITNSPRVVRRDTSLSNRKTGFKTNANDNTNLNSISMTTAKSSDERIPANVSKTDSLAVFLKYERELEKLNQLDSSGSAGRELRDALNKSASNSEVPSLHNATSNIVSPVFTKELKDKSNNLSKQNSSKSLRTEQEPIEETKPVKESQSSEQHKAQTPSMPTPTPTSKVASNLDNCINPLQADNLSTRQVRLEPIQHGNQLARSSSGQNKLSPPIKQPSQLPLLIQQPSGVAINSVPASASASAPPTQQRPNNLNSIFGGATNRPTLDQTSTFNKENKALSSSAEFIDPILINKCDNLPVKLADLKYVDSDSSTEQYNQVRHDRSTDTYERFVAPISQLSKLLPLVNKTNANTSTTAVQMRNAQTQSTPKHTRHIAVPSAITPNTPQQHTHNTILPRSTPENSSTTNTSGRNQLKRKMRLGRNQFLYDTSPEAFEVDSSCSADDETNPRSSAEYDSQLNNRFEQFIQKQTPQHHFKTPSPPNMPTLPIFDNFDFEEFLSSFENDDEEYPLFRDCREFLRNRQTNNKNSNSNKHNSTPKSPFDSSSYQNQNFFQFPVLNTPTTHQGNSINKTPAHMIILPSSRRSNTKTSMNRKEPPNDTAKSEDFHSARSGDSVSLPGEGGSIPQQQELRRESSGNFKKREIFISIETEQNDELGRTPISPKSLRDMVGNSQAVVEVEMDANDNKFSKISDDDNDNDNEINRNENANSSQHRLSGRNLKQQLPNVEMNNAKNLIQKMTEENHAIMGNEETLDNNNEEKNSTDPSSDKIEGICGGTGDSDEMSSLEGYPLASNSSSRRSAGVASKLSADSAYGSLSRQRSTELTGRSALRSSSRTRPVTAATSNIAQLQQQQQQFLLQQQYQQQLILQQQQQKQQQQLKYAQAMLKGARTRQLSGSSSSGSDNSLPPILVANSSHFQQQQQQQQHFLLQQQQQQQQQMAQLYQQQKARSRGSPITSTSSSSFALDVMNGNHPTVMTATTSTNQTLVTPPSNKPMSRFCHECGSKFLVEHAKFCMDCGVKRLMI